MWQKKGDIEYWEGDSFFTAIHEGASIHCNPDEVAIIKDGQLGKMSRADFDQLITGRKTTRRGNGGAKKPNSKAKSVRESEG